MGKNFDYAKQDWAAENEHVIGEAAEKMAKAFPELRGKALFFPAGFPAVADEFAERKNISPTGPRFASQLATLRDRRRVYIEYARHRIDDEDWHGVSDAANDLRELDVEIRMLEAQR